MYLERMQPTFPMGTTIATEKARTAALFQKPTKILEDAIVGGRTPLLNAWSAPLNGGEPILVEGQVVGAIGVSGASSAARDAAIALAGAGCAHRQDQREPGEGDSHATLHRSCARRDGGAACRAALAQADDSKVSLISHTSRSRPLSPRACRLSKSGDYKIHASRREGPGMAEIHTRDTDIAYVLQGSATLVTGGTAVDVKPIGAGGAARQRHSRAARPGSSSPATSSSSPTGRRTGSRKSTHPSSITW